MPPTTTSDREIVISRLFDAPRERVFEAWTIRGQIEKWWGPNGFTTTTEEMDVRPGGRWVFAMHGPDGADYRNWIVYREIVRPERLVYDHGDGGDAGAFKVAVTFEDQDGKTLVTMTSRFSSAADRESAIQEFGFIEGGRQMLARLAELVASTN